jgi:uncharacterized protein (DUF4415 family)
MNRKIVEYRIDPANPPPLTEAPKAELKALAAMDDADIDFSDIPEDLDWSSARRGVFYRPVKQSTTVRIDADVLHWLKAKGRGYQTRINAILREAMVRDGTAG